MIDRIKTRVWLLAVSVLPVLLAIGVHTAGRRW